MTSKGYENETICCCIVSNWKDLSYEMNIIVQGKQAREKWMRHELMCICYLKLEGLYIRLNWEFKLTTKISCMTEINMSSRWTDRIKVQDREACFKRLRKRRLGGEQRNRYGSKAGDPRVLESSMLRSVIIWFKKVTCESVMDIISMQQPEGKPRCTSY